MTFPSSSKVVGHDNSLPEAFGNSLSSQNSPSAHSEQITEDVKPFSVPFKFNFSLFDKLVNSRNPKSKPKFVFKGSDSFNIDVELVSGDNSPQSSEFQNSQMVSFKPICNNIDKIESSK